MTNPLPSDLQAELNRHLASGEYRSEEEVLRDALSALAEQQEDLAAVREAIAEWEAGDEGLPVEEVFAAIRKNLPTSASP